MTSKERVRNVILHKYVDKVPADFDAVPHVQEKLIKHFGFSNIHQVKDKFEIDICDIGPDYIGPELKKYKIEGDDVTEDHLGHHVRNHWTGTEYNGLCCYYPFNNFTTVEEIENFSWSNPDHFDYESIKKQIDTNKDKAIIIGHEGPFQVATFLRETDKLFMDMALKPEFAHKIYNRLVEFELEYYERIFIAGDGQIDILRTHDDYGTQISTLFSLDMWREYFAENTKKLTDLAHKYGAFFMQHSCGAIRPVIPDLIKCGVDVLDPIQKVTGLDPQSLKDEFGTEIAFHGGIDTQGVLPFGSTSDVKNETKRFISILGEGSGYILCSSQGLGGDVPLENIEAMYSVPR